MIRHDSKADIRRPARRPGNDQPDGPVRKTRLRDRWHGKHCRSAKRYATGDVRHCLAPLLI
jgi:hypothetical protein